MKLFNLNHHSIKPNIKPLLPFLAVFAIFFIFAVTVLVPVSQAQTLKDFNPFAGGGINCLYFFPSNNVQQGCTKDTAILNRVEGLMYNLAPAFAVIGVMLGGYNMMQDGYESKGKGLKYIQGSIIGLMVVYSAFFIRDLVYTVLNGTFNSTGATANSINNAGVQSVIKLLRTVAYDILVPIGTPIAVGFVIWGGYLLITAAGDPKRVSKGIDTIRNAVLGFLVIVFAAAIISISQNIFGGLLGTIK